MFVPFTNLVTKVRGAPIRVPSSGWGRSPGVECLANTLAFTVVLWVIAFREHLPESLRAVCQLSQGPNKNKPFFSFNGNIVSGRGGRSLHFQFLKKDCFVNLNDLFLPPLGLSSKQQSCSFKFKARFIWCFLPLLPGQVCGVLIIT